MKTPVTLIEGDRKLVILNPSHSAARKNSDLAHELSHLILEHKPTQVFFGPDKSLLIREFDRVQEAEAECLSSVLLVPREALLALLPISDDEMAAQQLGVSTQMFRMRRNVTGVDRQLARRWYRPAPVRRQLRSASGTISLALMKVGTGACSGIDPAMKEDGSTPTRPNRDLVEPHRQQVRLPEQSASW